MTVSQVAVSNKTLSSKSGKASFKKETKTKTKSAGTKKKSKKKTISVAGKKKLSNKIKNKVSERKITPKKVSEMNNDLENKQIIDTYRRWGHFRAQIDPLGLLKPFHHSELESIDKDQYPEMESAYCSKIGTEFMHMPYPDRCQWLSARLESNPEEIEELSILKRIVSVESFEKFLHTKYVGAKRFSLEGLASVIPLLDSILDQVAENGAQTVIIGMAHRGRLNVMHHIADTLAEHIVANFEDVDPRSALGGDDVKYHKGATGIYTTSYGKRLEVELAPNPSHLESVNPVVMGKARAKQDALKDNTGKKVVTIIIHGDAAFSGQGVAAEALNYASIPGFSIGGTVHVVINNLIGFTATQPALYSGRYCTDIAKRLDVPIFHVNGDSPNDVVRVGKLAADYRSSFSSDVVIDIVGYRRYGHNEVDDPTLTSPVVYQAVKARPILCEVYANEIGVGEEELKLLQSSAMEFFEESLKKGREITKKPKLEKVSSSWAKYCGGLYSPRYEVQTTISEEVLAQLGRALSKTPDSFNVHPKLQKLLEQRAEMALGHRTVDWGMAEALSFGSLILEGVDVRLVGQDCRRGTFNHRQAYLYDYQNGEPYSPLQNIEGSRENQFVAYDSMLSEAAAIGYEYGYTRENPDALVLWEAQFGDFVNGAQIIIDQFLSAGEDKWSTLSSLVLLLPHGYEGAGPEHSSARLERFLQLCAEDNMQVCQPSTASQYFHLLRRQARYLWKKPLIVINPKSMLRLPAACSPVSEFTSGGFRPVLDEQNDNYFNAEKLILCSGKIVHELRAERDKKGITNTAIATIEQFYPVPELEIRATIKKYSNLKTIIWVQDEPANMGGLFFVKPILDRLSGEIPVLSVKRSASASPATGSPKAHTMEQEALLRAAFNIGG